MEQARKRIERFWKSARKRLDAAWKKTKWRARDLWKNHRFATLATGGAILGLVLVVAGILILKRPDDKSCPAPCTISPTEQAPIVGIANWPFYGHGPARTRFLNAPEVKPPFIRKWRFKGQRLLEYSPILVGGFIYGINNNGLAFSVKTRTGHAHWKREIAQQNASAPAYGNHTLFYSNLSPGQVIALNQYTGDTVWRRALPGRTESSPVVVGNMVIAGCECGKLYAFEINTGKTLWQTDLPGEVKAAPAVEGGVAYVGDYSGVMSAVRISDGSIKWQSDSQGTGVAAGSFYGTAAVAFGRVYAGSKDGRIYSFNKDTGHLEWSHTIGGEVYAGTAVSDDPPTVFYGSYGSSTFYALDARNGSERWTAPVDGSVIGAASVIGDNVYVANLNTTKTDAFNVESGKKVWSFDDGAYNPVISDGKRLYLTGYKTLYALKPATEEEVAATQQKKAAKQAQKAAAAQAKQKP
jgi:outer membrane protein assembly factor BamB